MGKAPRVTELERDWCLMVGRVKVESGASDICRKGPGNKGLPHRARGVFRAGQLNLGRDANGSAPHASGHNTNPPGRSPGAWPDMREQGFKSQGSVPLLNLCSSPGWPGPRNQGAGPTLLGCLQRSGA